MSITSRICSLCCEKEFNNADIIDDRFWMCKNCREALMRVVTREKNQMRYERIMEQLEKGEDNHE